ncbi:MAG: UDP-N-acetylmuramate--L-alanine ligase [Deltaproteobacteria bacterium]|nr:UDP-N-acetylmuramate--L-alanine ligase [Deltaproteobacteria bacterium]
MYNPNLHFHFTGIGGVGMSGIAEVLLHQGFQVSGSDLVANDACARLEQLGAVISQGHSFENLPVEASLLVYSSAVPQDNPELVAARERGIPVVPRAEVLAELMRLKFGIAVAGSHGKTSTTSMIAHILEENDLDPTVIIGGQVKTKDKSGGRLGKGEFLVAESDESDRSFLLLKPSIAIVTNIDSEHLEAYSSMSDLEQCFEQFLHSVPFYGLAVLCVDDARVRKIAEFYSRRKITYGFSPDAELRIENYQSNGTSICFDVVLHDQHQATIDLPMLGKHMAQNALAAIAVALELGLSIKSISKALQSFPGIKRRLEIIGQKNGTTVMSDYGHHPTEIKATLSALQASSYGEGDIHVIFQPHRYTRTKDCFADFLNSFEACDSLIVTDIHAASEKPIEGISGEELCKAITHESKAFNSDFGSIASQVAASAKPGDLVICFGAGSIGKLPNLILDQMG